MNYTKNYHLPQWAKEDRIMMDDFNQMCADLETRLTGRDNAAADGSGLTWNAILRSAWNMMDSQHALAADTGISSWSGLTVNPLASADMASGLSGITWLDEASGVYIGSGPEVPETILRETCTGKANGLLSSDFAAESRTATYSFTAPLTGNVTAITIQGQILITPTADPFPGLGSFRAEEKNGGSWRTVCQKANIPMVYRYNGELGGSSRIRDQVSVNVPVTKGKEYRFTLLLENGNDTGGVFGFVSGAHIGDTSELVNDSLFTTGGQATRALALAYYRTAQSGGSVSAALGGQAMTQAGNQTVIYKDGQPCQRACFQLEGSFSGSPTLRLNLSCGASNTLRLLSYAVMFL